MLEGTLLLNMLLLCLLQWFSKRLGNIYLLITFIFFTFFVETKVNIFIVFINRFLFLVLALHVLRLFLGVVYLTWTFFFLHKILFTLIKLTRSRANNIWMSFQLLRYSSKWRFHIFFMLSIYLGIVVLLLNNCCLLLLLLTRLMCNSLITFITIILLGKDIHHFIFIIIWPLFGSVLFGISGLLDLRNILAR